MTKANTSRFSGQENKENQNEENRHDGMSQLMVDLHVNGVTIRPITFLTGAHHFNEVFFENVFVPENWEEIKVTTCG